MSKRAPYQHKKEWTDDDSDVAEWLFMRTFEDLTGTVQQDRQEQTVTRYGYLHLGALLRKLLVDNPPLVQHANRRTKMPLEFHVHEMDPRVIEQHYRDGGGTLSMKDGLFPGAQETPVLRLTLAQFLNHKVMIVEGTFVTIREMIKYVANVEGGVHWGAGGTQAEKNLARYTPGLIRARLTDNLSEAQLAGASPIGPVMGIAQVVANDLFGLYLMLVQQRENGSELLTKMLEPVLRDTQMGQPPSDD